MKRPSAYAVFLFLEGAASLLFSFVFSASSIYLVTIAKLEPLQLVLVGTALEAAVFLFEVPTGVVADVFSRRLSIIIGYLLIGAGFILEGSIPIFLPIILAQVLWGLGYTFTSGATQAWISDEIGETAANQAFLRSSQVSQVTALVGIGLGAVLGSLGISLPIVVGGICLAALGVILIFIMPETGFKPAPRAEQNSWQAMGHTFRSGIAVVRTRPALTNVLLVGFFYGLYSEGFDRLWTKLILDNFSFPDVGNLQPVVWFALMRGIGMLLSIAGVEAILRWIDTENMNHISKALLVLTAVLAASLLVFALGGWLAVVVIAYWLIYVARNIISPLYTAWVNQKLEPQVRATILSMSSQVDAIGQVASGPILGLVGSLVSVRAAIVGSAILLTPIFVLLNRARNLGSTDSPTPGSTGATIMPKESDE